MSTTRPYHAPVKHVAPAVPVDYEVEDDEDDDADEDLDGEAGEDASMEVDHTDGT